MRFLFKTRYEQDIALARHGGHVFWYGLLVLALLVAPFVLPQYWLEQLSFVLIYGIVGLGLMLLSGFTGLFSMGHGAFMGVGAYAQVFFVAAGVPFPLAMLLAMLITAAAGFLVGLPALRVKGIYLAISTGVLNLLRAPTGRAFVAVRDSEISAQSMGIHVARTKTLSFAISAALAGLGGALYAHKLQFISPDQFSLLQSIELLMLVVIGGLGSIHGAFFGAIFLIVMPQLIAIGKDFLPAMIGEAPGLQSLVYGLILILFVLFEPLGIYGRWLKIRTWLEIFPFYRQDMFRRQKAFLKSDRLK